MKGLSRTIAVAAIVAVVGILAVGAVALAQDTDDGSAWPFDFRQRMHEAVANILGISPEAYDDAVDTARNKVLNEAVAEGLLTQEQADRMQERAEQGFGPGSRGGRHGAWRGPGGRIGGPQNSLMAVAAEELGLTTEELLAELQDGKAIADVAAAVGVELQDIADAFVDQRAQVLSQAVEDGRITQERADWMLEQMQEEVLEHLSEPLPMGGQGPGGCWDEAPGTFRGGPRMRPGGGFPGFPGGDDA